MHDKHVFGITVMIDHDTEKFCKRMSWHYSTTTDEEYLSILTDRRGAIIHRIETLKSFKTLP